MGRKENSELKLKNCIVGFLLLGVLVLAHNVHQVRSLYPPGIEWSRTFGMLEDEEIEKEDVARALIQTTDGGYAMLGYTRFYPSGPWVYTSDFWLIKTDPDGNEEWNQTYGLPGYSDQESGTSIVQTYDGGYALVGYSGLFPELESHDLWMVKTDSAGNMEWNKTYGGAEDDRGYSVLQVSDGYVIVGYTASYGAGSYDFWLLKTDSAGNMQWNRTYDGGSSEHAYSAILTSDGGYVMAGTTGSFGAGLRDFWLIKVDSAGNMQWNKTFGGINYDTAYSVLQTSDGGYAVAGRTDSFGAGDDDFYLVRTDSGGNMVWNETYGGISHDRAYSLMQTSDDGYLLAGDYNFSGWLIKTDSMGALQWNITLCETGCGYAVVPTIAECFTVAGESRIIPYPFDALLVKVCLGDVNGDGLINIIDLTLVSFAYGSFEGEPDYNPDADLNSDGIIDMQDLVIVARNLGKT